MERKRELTKNLLAESFKELLIKGSFDTRSGGSYQTDIL